MPPPRATYAESGEVSLPGFLLASGGLILPAVALAFAMGGLSFTPFSPVLIAAIIAGLALGSCAGWVFQLAHCRNSLLAGVIAGALGVLAYLGQFHAMLIIQGGAELIPRVDLVPAYTADIVNSWTIGNIGAGNNNAQPIPIVNWILFGVELVACAGMAGFFAHRALQKAYCERCERWMDLASTRLLRVEAQVLSAAIHSDQVAGLPNLIKSRDATAPHAVVTVERCAHFDRSPTTWYLSLEEQANPSENESGTEILKPAQLTPSEVDQLARQLPELFPASARTAGIGEVKER